MKWVASEPEAPRRVEDRLAIAERILAADPSPAAHAEVGRQLRRLNRLDEALAAFEIALNGDPEGFRCWSELADTLARLRRYDEALAVVDRGEAIRGPRATLAFRRGVILQKIGRVAEARERYTATLAYGPNEPGALTALLETFLTEPDGALVLAALDALPEAYRAATPVRAARAVALSRLGRAEEARELIDLDAHVARIRFDPPEGLDTFNRALAGEILADPPHVLNGEGFAIHYTPRTDGPAMRRLLDFTRAQIEAYLARRAAMGAETALPYLPEAARLTCATNVLTGPGTNGEHIHGGAYVSTVYHVRVPEMVRMANDNRGALLLGACSTMTGGHQGSWGLRAIRPEPGWLTIVPSHVFHTVVPTGDSAPRISVACDMRPVSVLPEER